MILCGDFVYPYEDTSSFSIIAPDEFIKVNKIINFESSLVGACKPNSSAPIPLLSSKYSLSILEKLNCKIACLANNHTFDYQPNFDELFRLFEEKNIKIVGAGKNINEAKRPVIYGNFVVLNFGWNVIGCKKATHVKSGCNPLDYAHVIHSFENTKNEYPDKKIIIVFHWGYEFEIYPMPSHRELCRKLSALGAYAIVGHHAHIILGMEYFGKTPVFYGLGNFFMPKHKFGDFLLNYPSSAKIGLAVDLTFADSPKCYFIEIDNRNNLSVKESVDSREFKINSRSEFSDLNDSEYVEFFKLNRAKRKGLPIYKSISDSVVINDLYVYYRQCLIDLLVKLKIKR